MLSGAGDPATGFGGPARLAKCCQGAGEPATGFGGPARRLGGKEGLDDQKDQKDAKDAKELPQCGILSKK